MHDGLNVKHGCHKDLITKNEIGHACDGLNVKHGCHKDLITKNEIGHACDGLNVKHGCHPPLQGVRARQRSRYLRFSRPPQEKFLQESRKKLMKEKNAANFLR